jgi:hypothetical protein
MLLYVRMPEVEAVQNPGGRRLASRSVKFGVLNELQLTENEIAFKVVASVGQKFRYVR